MRGVRIYGSTFSEAFAPAIDLLDRFAIYGVTFRIPLSTGDAETAEAEALLRPLSLDGDVRFDDAYFRPGFLSRFASRVSDDWNGLWFFDEPHRSREEIQAELPVASSAKSILDGFEDEQAAVLRLAPVALIHNWDGAFWQIFTKRKEIVTALVQDWSRRGANWREVDFRVEYPHPSDVALRYVLDEREKKRKG